MPNTDARLLQTVSNNRSVDAFHQSSYASTLFQTTQTKKVSFFFYTNNPDNGSQPPNDLPLAAEPSTAGLITL